MLLYKLSILSILPLFFFCNAEDETAYIFELSDEPVKVKPSELDTTSIFFPRYAKGTTTESITQPLLPDDTLLPPSALTKETTVEINLDSSGEKDNASSTHQGYEFYFSPSEKELIISTEPNDPSVWINDGDMNSPFFRSATSLPSNPQKEDEEDAATKVVSELLPGFFPLLPKYTSEKND